MDPPSEPETTLSGRLERLWRSSAPRLVQRFDAGQRPLRLRPLPHVPAPTPVGREPEPARGAEPEENSLDLMGLLGFGGGFGLLLYVLALLFRTPGDALAARGGPLPLVVMAVVAGALLYVGIQSLRAEKDAKRLSAPAAGPARVARPEPQARGVPATLRRRPVGSKRAVVEVAVAGGILVALYVLARVLLHTSVPFAVVPSDSMSPALERGDLLLVRGEEALEVGDIVVFRVPESFRGFGPDIVVHRVVAVEQVDGRPAYRTQGDHNPTSDPYTITREDVLGHMFLRVPFAGHAVLFLKSPGGVLIVALLALAPALIARARRSEA